MAISTREQFQESIDGIIRAIYQSQVLSLEDMRFIRDVAVERFQRLVADKERDDDIHHGE